MYNKITFKHFGSFLRNTFLVLCVMLSTVSLSAQTVSTASGANYLGDYSINNAGALFVTFVVENTNATAKVLTSVSTQVAPYFTATAGAPSTAKLYYSATSLSGAFALTDPSWTQVATGSTTVPAALAVVPVLSGLTIVIPANTQYRFAIELSKGLAFSFSPTPAPNTFTTGGVTLKLGTALIAGSAVGYAGVSPTAPAGNAGAFFGGSITLTDCVPANATAPVISAVPASTCAGSPITLNVVGGSLNGASDWKWYTASCGGTLVGTGSSITVSPAATTTYYVRGEGGCAPAAGPCATRLVTVTNCTCISPDLATICEGSIQKLMVTPPAVLPTQTFTNSTLITVGTVAAGPFSVYPNTLAVTGIPLGSRVKSVTINGISHTFPADIDIALVSPTSTPVILMSDVGGGTDLVNVNYTFDDAAAAVMTGVLNPAGTYRPTNITVPDAFIAPGPGSLSQATPTLSSFTGNMNGTWNLFAVDDAGGDGGSITGFSITFEIFPTAIWTGGTLFTDPAATVPYVAGTQANAVYVKPAATTVYTATIASGPCAGANNVTVTVLPVPVVTISPATGGCGPLTLTASGAVSYTWSPGTGLNTTTGATVIANPNVNTTYTVTGTGTTTCQSTASVLVNSAPTASVISALAAPIYQIQEGFTVAPPAGWTVINNSNPLGITSWFQGLTAQFNSFNGAANSYAAADWRNTTQTAAGDISTWMLTPVINIKNGDEISFFTRTTTATFPDRLEVRLSTAGNSTNVGSTTTSIGDFTTLLLSVNPTLVAGAANYPTTWTKFSAIITGITGTVPGRIGFRYFVPNGGGGANSDYIGVDQVEYSSPPLPICANVVSNLAVNITGGVSPYTLVYSNGTTNTTINGYTSNALIQVSPAATTTYTVVSVTGANGCVGTNNSGSAVITITPPPSITTQPANKSVCVGNNTTFTLTAGPAVGNNYQWQVSTDAGATYNNVTNAGVYSGATTSTLSITAAPITMTGYMYRVVIAGACPPGVTSSAATLTVNNPAVIATQPVNTKICIAGLTSTTATFSVVATGGGLTYQWQVSVDGVAPYTNIIDGANYSGATTNTLRLSNVTSVFANYRYRVNVSSGGCTAVTSGIASVTVNATPIVTLTANPLSELYPGQTTTLSVAVSPNAAVTYTWFKNGVIVPGATASTLVVNVDAVGVYKVNVTDVNGCTGASATKEIKSAANDNLFIYPSPSTGQFQVRYFSEFSNTIFPRFINIYDSKGSRIFTKSYSINSPYTRLDVDIKNHGKGIYQVELTDSEGNRIKTGRVLIL